MHSDGAPRRIARTNHPGAGRKAFQGAHPTGPSAPDLGPTPGAVKPSRRARDDPESTRQSFGQPLLLAPETSKIRRTLRVRAGTEAGFLEAFRAGRAFVAFNHLLEANRFPWFAKGAADLAELERDRRAEPPPHCLPGPMGPADSRWFVADERFTRLSAQVRTGLPGPRAAPRRSPTTKSEALAPVGLQQPHRLARRQCRPCLRPLKRALKCLRGRP